MRQALIKTSQSLVMGMLGSIALAANFFVGRPEGHWFPVVSNMQVLAVTQLKDGYLDYEITADKLRNCEPEGARVFYTAAGYTIEALIKRDPDFILMGRPLGHQRVHLKLSVPPEYYSAPLTFIAAHKCFGPLGWTTFTPNAVQYSGPLFQEGKDR